MIRSGKTGLLIGMGAAAVLLAAAGAFAQEKSMTPLSGGVPMVEGIKMLEVGSMAPDFSVKDTGGAIYDFREEKAKRPTLLVFWSIFCEPCRFEMPVVQKLHEKYPDRLSVVSVALDGEPLKTSIVGFVRQEGYTFRVLVDELDEKELFKVADPFGVAGTPTVFIVDRAGKVALAKVGRFKEEELEKVIQSVLK
jgi:thiol-disulfide isomerase/thioredoxin